MLVLPGNRIVLFVGVVGSRGTDPERPLLQADDLPEVRGDVRGPVGLGLVADDALVHQAGTLEVAAGAGDHGLVRLPGLEQGRDLHGDFVVQLFDGRLQQGLELRQDLGQGRVVVRRELHAQDGARDFLALLHVGVVRHVVGHLGDALARDGELVVGRVADADERGHEQAEVVLSERFVGDDCHGFHLEPSLGRDDAVVHGRVVFAADGGDGDKLGSFFVKHCLFLLVWLSGRPGCRPVFRFRSYRIVVATNVEVAEELRTELLQGLAPDPVGPVLPAEAEIGVHDLLDALAVKDGEFVLLGQLPVESVDLLPHASDGLVRQIRPVRFDDRADELQSVRYGLDVALVLVEIQE